ncbi:MAG: tRNA-(ms[2]io[6]A)-hydroxylase [Gammaproteobacteria bacterium]
MNAANPNIEPPVADELLACPTPAPWIAAVKADLDTFLVDHAACERKASAMAVSMICHYPDRPALIGPMSDLALEEMAHYRDVLRLIGQRGITLTRDAKDPYVNQLRAAMRTERDGFFQDRLLVAGLIEARGAERFALLATHLETEALRRFYHRFAQSEARHFRLFLDLADEFFPAAENATRLDTLRDIEAAIIEQLPARAALH